MRKVAVLINPSAGLNRKSSFIENLPTFLHSHQLIVHSTCTLDHNFCLQSQTDAFVHAALSRSIDSFIAVGGDGTVNLLALTLIQQESDSSNVILGAIGTGSSNDFHKPLVNSYRGIPIKLNFAKTTCVDMVRVEANGKIYGFLNGFSVGFVAEANQRFNHPTPLLKLLKKLHIPSAINYTALQELLRPHHHKLTLQIDDHPIQPLNFWNLNLLKNRHVAGSFLYEPMVGRHDQKLALHWVTPCSLFAKLRILFNLSRARFRGQPNTHSATIATARFFSDNPFAFEVDGEVYYTTQACLGCFARPIRLAT